ncbi:40S ribosomal protein S10 [Elysia marginata]|uniref:40S ribosomal protein S10 n=1 Tax=Elysia marginata TaxID=1093978 RepID=A0AAV4EYB6_9GAST|nr:40S ribosomal protein S10 [Elysia marginata]
MLIPKKNRVQIYEYLFKEGCLVAKDDKTQNKHPNIDVPNLEVIKALESLTSRGYVRVQFAWRHFYWYLTNEGIQYLRDFLHLPAEIVPSTLKRATRTEAPKPRFKAGTDKKAEVGAGSQDLEFRGGYGRGRGGFGGSSGQ